MPNLYALHVYSTGDLTAADFFAPSDPDIEENYSDTVEEVASTNSRIPSPIQSIEGSTSSAGLIPLIRPWARYTRGLREIRLLKETVLRRADDTDQWISRPWVGFGPEEEEIALYQADFNDPTSLG